MNFCFPPVITSSDAITMASAAATMRIAERSKFFVM